MFLWLFLAALVQARIETNFTVITGYDEIYVKTPLATYESKFSRNFWIGSELIYRPLLKEMSPLNSSHFIFDIIGEDGIYGELRYDLKKVTIDLIRVKEPESSSHDIEKYVVLALILSLVGFLAMLGFLTILNYCYENIPGVKKD